MQATSSPFSLPSALTVEAVGVVRGQALPAVPPRRVRWVNDAAGVGAMRDAVLDLATRNAATAEGHPPVVGLDAEWKPGARTPVSILQVATRTESFVVDLFACAPSDAPACEALDVFLGDMLRSEALYKLGFSFGYDLSRMRASYPHLASLRGSQPRSMLDVKQVAYSASANGVNLRVSLATLTKFVLGATLSKAEQCSDWSRRPLTSAQLAYAAADAFYLNLIFDKCVTDSNGRLLTQLDEMVAIGDPRAKGKHMPRKAKKAHKKQMALAAKLIKQGGGMRLGHTQREPNLCDAEVNVEATLGKVGEAVDGGRKGATKMLSGGGDVRTGPGASRGSAVEEWANAAVLYLSVGQPGKSKRGVGQFWEETPGGDVIMRPDEACFAGTKPEVMARFAGATTGAVRTVADVEAAVEVDDRDEDGERDGAAWEKGAARDEEMTRQTALLFMRRPPGSYVFCGRLEAREGGVGDGEARDAVDVFRLVDTAALRTSSTFHQLIGCRLLAGAPEDV